MPTLCAGSLKIGVHDLSHKPGRNRAKANIRGQNGKFSRTRPRVVATTCQQRRKAKRKAGASHGRRWGAARSR